MAVGGKAWGQAAAAALPPPVHMTAEEDMKRMCDLLHVEPLLVRPAYNYDESKANPYPKLPDALVLKNGHKVTNAKVWWNQRRFARTTKSKTKSEKSVRTCEMWVSSGS